MLAFGATVDKLVVIDVSVLYRHLAERGLGFFVLEIYIFIIWGGVETYFAMAWCFEWVYSLFL